MKNVYEELLCCPQCHKKMRRQNNAFSCIKCDVKLLVKGNIIFNQSIFSDELQMSSDKWDILYDKELREKEYSKKYQDYIKRYFLDVYNQLNNVKPIHHIVYLEIGCGDFFWGKRLRKIVKS
jgi:hypothetical protein